MWNLTKFTELQNVYKMQILRRRGRRDCCALLRIKDLVIPGASPHGLVQPNPSQPNPSRGWFRIDRS